MARTCHSARPARHRDRQKTLSSAALGGRGLRLAISTYMHGSNPPTPVSARPRGRLHRQLGRASDSLSASASAHCAHPARHRNRPRAPSSAALGGRGRRLAISTYIHGSNPPTLVTARPHGELHRQLGRVSHSCSTETLMSSAVVRHNCSPKVTNFNINHTDFLHPGTWEVCVRCLCTI